ncbi:hypothetical protein [Rhizobium sp. 18065]|uniref:hypothetical protein n=1 Tax=Rhizobium sp. 18065 TaxID=2681411 RepID=UPI00135BFDEE|nr:hypothetical protein [Rhizobium sp. 18065]
MALSEKHDGALAVSSRHAMIALSSLTAMLILAWVLKYSSYGIDFTDEGFYLASISNPFLYDFSVTQFGFVYHPLHLLLGGDIAALRQANILATFFLAWGLTHTLLGAIAPEARADGAAFHTVAVALATSVLVAFNLWLLTPSYQSLALQSLLLTSIGLLMLEREWHSRSFAGAVMTGMGGWLAFMAKPSTAAALAACALLYILACKKMSPRLLAIMVASAVIPLILSAIAIDGSLWKFAERLQLGLEYGQAIGGGHAFSKLLRIDTFALTTKGTLLVLTVFAMAFLSVWGFLSGRTTGMAISLIGVVGFSLPTALIIFDQLPSVSGLGRFQGLSLLGVLCAATLSGLMLGKQKFLGGLSAAQWGVASLLLITPHMYAFGTNRNYWESGVQAGLFWLLSGFVLLGPVARERSTWAFALPLVLASQALTVMLLQSALEHPYRQPQSIRSQDAIVPIGPQKSQLTVSKDYAFYISNAVLTANGGGFVPGIPVIDLSGQSPTLLYAIGAKNIGAAWLIGGYPGSSKYAKAVLGRVSCEKISEAWLLVEPTGPRSIPTDLLADLGAAFPQNYQLAASWNTAQGAGGYATSRIQNLYRPKNPAGTLRLCNSLREKAAE